MIRIWLLLLLTACLANSLVEHEDQVPTAVPSDYLFTAGIGQCVDECQVRPACRQVAFLHHAAVGFTNCYMYGSVWPLRNDDKYTTYTKIETTSTTTEAETTTTSSSSSTTTTTTTTTTPSTTTTTTVSGGNQQTEKTSLSQLKGADLQLAIGIPVALIVFAALLICLVCVLSYFRRPETKPPAVEAPVPVQPATQPPPTLPHQPQMNDKVKLDVSGHMTADRQSQQSSDNNVSVKVFSGGAGGGRMLGYVTLPPVRHQPALVHNDHLISLSQWTATAPSQRVLARPTIPAMDSRLMHGHSGTLMMGSVNGGFAGQQHMKPWTLNRASRVARVMPMSRERKYVLNISPMQQHNNEVWQIDKKSNQRRSILNKLPDGDKVVKAANQTEFASEFDQQKHFEQPDTFKMTQFGGIPSALPTMTQPIPQSAAVTSPPNATLIIHDANRVALPSAQVTRAENSPLAANMTTNDMQSHATGYVQHSTKDQSHDPMVETQNRIDAQPNITRIILESDSPDNIAETSTTSAFNTNIPTSVGTVDYSNTAVINDTAINPAIHNASSIKAPNSNMAVQTSDVEVPTTSSTPEPSKPTAQTPINGTNSSGGQHLDKRVSFGLVRSDSAVRPIDSSDETLPAIQIDPLIEIPEENLQNDEAERNNTTQNIIDDTDSDDEEDYIVPPPLPPPLRLTEMP